MIFRDFHDFELPFYRCEDAYKYIEEENGKALLKCEGFYYREKKKVCTICKNCKYLQRQPKGENYGLCD